MTEKLKMIRGEMYDSMDSELVEGRKKARLILSEINKNCQKVETEKLIQLISSSE